MLNSKDFARFKELKAKGKDLSPEEAKEFKKLLALKGKKKGNGKSGGKKDPEDGADKAVHYNDYSWWNQYPELMDTAVKLPFNYLPGQTLFDKNGGLNSASIREISGVTGAVAHAYINKYGCDNDVTNGVNAAFRQLWLSMHRTYRGIGTYQAADLGIVQIATIEVLSCIAEIERVYGVINKFGIINRNLPYTLLAAMGVSNTLADDIRLNMADFRYGLNEQILKAQSMCVFKDMPVVLDKLSLAANVFLDRDSDDAQAIVYTLGDIGLLSSTTVPTGFSVEYPRVGYFHGSWLQSMNTFSDILQYLSVRIEAIVSDEDVQRIYSDMVAAFGADKLLFALPLAEDYQVNPVYTEEILHKEVNMYHLSGMTYLTEDEPTWSEPTHIFIGSIIPTNLYNDAGWDPGADKTGYRITQYNNIINTRTSLFDGNAGGNIEFSFTTGPFSGYTMKVSYGEYLISYGVTDMTSGQGILNTFKDPTDELTCEGVLWKYGTTSYRIPNGQYVDYIAHEITTCGPELFSFFRYYTKTATPTGVVIVNTGQVNQGQFIYNGVNGIIQSFENVPLALIRGWSLYDWQFQLYCVEFDDPSTFPSMTNVTNVGEIDNVRIVNGHNIRPIHRAAFMSMYKCDLTTIK